MNIVLPHGISGYTLGILILREEGMILSQLGLSTCHAYQVKIRRRRKSMMEYPSPHYGGISISAFRQLGKETSMTSLSSSECPLLVPTPGHLCSAPSGPLDCRYAADHCCCGQCFKSFKFLCLPDAITGTGLWQTSPLCPAEGCGNEGLKH